MKTSNTKNYWLMKSEPESWSWDQQKKKKTEHWDGTCVELDNLSNQSLQGRACRCG